MVDLGRDVTWEELIEASRTQRRVKPLALEMREVKELIRSAKTPIPFKEVDGRIVRRPDMVAQRDEAIEVFRRLLVRQLELTPRKEVFIYVHGYNNSFDDAAFAMGELWHFLGRIGVPIVYAWPAGYPGMFGYTSPQDKAIGFAARLFASPRGRLGTLGIEEIPDEIGDVLDYSGSNLSIVNFAGAADVTVSQGDSYGHSGQRSAERTLRNARALSRNRTYKGPLCGPFRTMVAGLSPFGTRP